MAQISTDEFPFKDETYKLIGICMEAHRRLGHGFLEIVYKDAIETDLRSLGIDYAREVEYKIEYKGIILPHRFFADFVVFNCVILEIKALEGGLADAHLAQMINYLKASRCRIGLLVNFGRESLQYKRFIL